MQTSVRPAPCVLEEETRPYEETGGVLPLVPLNWS